MTDHASHAFRPNNTVTVHGANSGNIASGNRDVTQFASTQGNMATADIAEIMRAVIEVAGSLNMADRDREELVRAAESVQYEIEGPNPDDGKIKSLGFRVIRFLGLASGSVVSVVLTKYLELKLGLGSAE
ncbi:hypothetical protein U2F26_33370 [Micromonospora sp. 4G57]|uniref:Uncharacterized protein n=1 Tax=Micromonospora sicca TaxID=2202420 RepID=A0ABU5JNT2_9ACTN|nr:MULTISPECIES: hypothetical protein [unclassified Micromonospora]MDZ5447542.1 hypothetical protein [Micromonospora sp. 4G57]MDZ5494302.1 hypothetical protein [Micromonospora sp. 4G53]